MIKLSSVFFYSDASCQRGCSFHACHLSSVAVEARFKSQEGSYSPQPVKRRFALISRSNSSSEAPQIPLQNRNKAQSMFLAFHFCSVVNCCRFKTFCPKGASSAALQTPHRERQNTPLSSASVDLGAALCSCIVTVSSEDVPLEVVCVYTHTGRHTHTLAPTASSIVCESSGQLIKAERNTKAGPQLDGSGSHTSFNSAVRKSAKLNTPFFCNLEITLGGFNTMLMGLFYAVMWQEPDRCTSLLSISVR